MKKINNNLMVLGLKTLSMLAFSLLVIPSQALATPGYVDNPIPYIASISPDSNNSQVRASMIITITGNGFIPGSVARVDGSDRATTFIDYSHLLIRLNSNDISSTDGFYINVFNGFPGGGYSNAEYFTTKSKASVAGATTNNNQASSNYSGTNQAGNVGNSVGNDSKTTDTANGNSSNLAATAIFGTTGSFLPSGLIQWVVFAIIIMIIVILVRKTFGARKKYEESPMKHA